MQKEHPQRETLALKEKDTAVVSEYSANTYFTALHYHPEFEIVLTVNGTGMHRTIGRSTETTDDTELLLLGPNLCHKWDTGSSANTKKQIISIHFNTNFLSALSKGEQEKLQGLLNNATHGILLSQETAIALKDRFTNIIILKKKNALAEITSILTVMAYAPGSRLLNYSSDNSSVIIPDYTMAGLDSLLKKKYRQKLTLEEVCKYTGKSLTSFNRYIKKQTGSTFINYLNQLRAGFAGRKLIETSQTVSAVAESSGFNNLSHFNRVFKQTYRMTPLQYRKTFYGRKKFI